MSDTAIDDEGGKAALPPVPNLGVEGDLSDVAAAKDRWTFVDTSDFHAPPIQAALDAAVLRSDRRSVRSSAHARSPRGARNSQLPRYVVRHSPPPYLRPPGGKRLHTAADTFLRRHARVALTRERSLSLHTQLQTEWQACVHLREYMGQSQQGFMNALNGAMHTGTLGDSAATLGDLHHQVLQDTNALEEQASKTRQLEIDIGSHDYSLQAEEGRLAQAGEMVVHLLRTLYSGHAPSQSASDDSSFSRQSYNDPPGGSTSIEPLLADYYDKVGDVKIMQERLINDEFEHQEAVGDRALRAEQQTFENFHDDTDEFMRLYLEQRILAEKELDDALAAAEKARAACLEAGIEVRSIPQAPSAPSAGSEELQTPAIVDVETPGQLRGLPSQLSLVDRITSSSMLTGPMCMSTSPLPVPKPDTAHVNRRVADWIQKLEEVNDGGIGDADVSSRDDEPLLEDHQPAEEDEMTQSRRSKADVGYRVRMDESPNSALEAGASGGVNVAAAIQHEQTAQADAAYKPAVNEDAFHEEPASREAMQYQAKFHRRTASAASFPPFKPSGGRNVTTKARLLPPTLKEGSLPARPVTIPAHTNPTTPTKLTSWWRRPDIFLAAAFTAPSLRISPQPP